MGNTDADDRGWDTDFATHIGVSEDISERVGGILNNGRDWIIRVLIGLSLFLAGFVVSGVQGSQETKEQVRENTTKITIMEKTLERIEYKLDEALKQ